MPRSKKRHVSTMGPEEEYRITAKQVCHGRWVLLKIYYFIFIIVTYTASCRIMYVSHDYLVLFKVQ